MSLDLGTRIARGTADPSNPQGAGFWTVSFTPRVLAIPMDFEVYHIALKGPIGSQFQIFLDSSFYDNVIRGDVNSWDPNQAMYVRRGQTIFFYWNTAAAPAPNVTIFCRQTSAI